MPDMSWYEPDTRILQAMLNYAKVNRPDDVPEIERRILESSLSAGVRNFRPEDFGA